MNACTSVLTDSVSRCLMIVGHACYIRYRKQGTGRGRSPPRPLLAVPNVTAHPSTGSVTVTVCIMGRCSVVLMCPWKGYWRIRMMATSLLKLLPLTARGHYTMGCNTIRYDTVYLTCNKKLRIASLVYHTEWTKMWNKQVALLSQRGRAMFRVCQ